MAADVTMPKLTDSMEEGRIVAWRVGPGDPVAEGDVIAEIETDKAVMELESFWAGSVTELLREAGDVVPVGEVIARITEGKAAGASPGAGERSELQQEGAALERRIALEKETELTGAEGAPVPPAPRERPAATEVSRPTDEVPLPGAHPLSERDGRESPRPAPAEPKRAGPSAPPRRQGVDVRASPRARKMAQEKGIDLVDITGSGPEGRVLSSDVEAAALGGMGGLRMVQRRGAAAWADEELPPVSFSADEAEVEEVSFYQKAAIRRVVASKHVIPHFYVTKTVRADELLRRKGSEEGKSGASLTHLLLRATLLALAKFPEANRSYDRGHWIHWKKVNLGLAIQTDAGLVVGVLKDTTGKDLPWIAARTRELVARARSGKLTPDERSNATFTLSNLGAYDVESFSAIINPPSAMTLAVGSVMDSPVVERGKIVAGSLMHLTLSCDHRVVDGVLGAKFLGEVKRVLEAPADL